jgi:hypothetical protein
MGRRWQAGRMTTRTDWYGWHHDYAEAGSPLSVRLRIVQRRIAEWLDARPEPSLTVVSMCAGQGRDLLEVLAGRADAGRARARLLETDDRNATIARDVVAAANLGTVTVVRADAGERASYRGTVPADLVLMAGVLGNITDADVRATVEVLPELCAPGATVIWTRTREEPDLMPAIRSWFVGTGFVEDSFDAPDGMLISVGVHRFTGDPRPLADGTFFQFVR